MLKLAVLLSLLVANFGTLLTLRIVPSFVPNDMRTFSNGSNFTGLLLIESGLYVGAKDSLFKLDAANIENTLPSSSYASVSLPANIEQKEQCISTYYDEKLCNNFVKMVLNRPSERDLYVCGTYSFTPRLFQLSYDLALVKEDDGYGYCSLNPLDSSTAVWVESGNPMSIPSLYSGSLLDASTKTQPVEPVIYRPELKRNDKSFQYLRTPKFDSDWLFQPTFITSFDVDDYVLFFLREKSLEQAAEGQPDSTYSRVVRVCKSDTGSLNLGNQWSSMRKTRLTCVYNNTYLNELEDVVRVDENSFVGLFTLRLPGKSAAASFLCEFQKQALLSGLSAPATNFKEVIAGTQYWARVAADKIPKSIPSQCNYNSQLLKDDVANFLKTHCLIGDHIDGTLKNFVNQPVTSIAVDTIVTSNKETNNDVRTQVYYLGTADGRVIKMSSMDMHLIISEWKVIAGGAPITEMKIRAGSALYVATEDAVVQVSLAQCERYNLCSTCMNDPYCGWNIRKSQCEDVKQSKNNLVSLNTNLCSRFQRQENVKVMQLDSSSTAFVQLECNIADSYLFEFVEWRKDQKKIDFSDVSSKNMFLTWNRDLVLVGGNSSQNGVYNCYVDKTELMNSYSLTYKQATKLSNDGFSPAFTSPNQKCITAENYIKQYNSWCDEYSKYHKALNEWEDLKDKSCTGHD